MAPSFDKEEGGRSAGTDFSQVHQPSYQSPRNVRETSYSDGKATLPGYALDRELEQNIPVLDDPVHEHPTGDGAAEEHSDNYDVYSEQVAEEVGEESDADTVEENMVEYLEIDPTDAQSADQFDQISDVEVSSLDAEIDEVEEEAVQTNSIADSLVDADTIDEVEVKEITADDEYPVYPIDDEPVEDELEKEEEELVEESGEQTTIRSILQSMNPVNRIKQGMQNRSEERRDQLVRQNDAETEEENGNQNVSGDTDIEQDHMLINDAAAVASDHADAIYPAEGFDKLSQIDYYVKLHGERDVSRDSVLAIYRESSIDISKTHSIYGLKQPEKVWRNLEDESEQTRFGELIVTIQLADQNGPVSEYDMTRFSSLIMKLSESTGRGFTFMAPIENAHAQAVAIDRFRKRFDSIYVLNIRPLESDMFEGPVIHRCATQIGLTQDENNFFSRIKPVGKNRKVILYSLANMNDTGEFDMENLRADRTRGVTFFTRPAIHGSPGAVFTEMLDAAKAFASRIKGEIVVPGHDGMSADELEAIRVSIEKVASEMESYGISPGSEGAAKLF